MIPYEESVQRTRRILQRQLANRILSHDWEYELAALFGLEIPDQPIEELLELFEAQTAHTPFPDGIGPWRPHPVWAEESYGVGHIRSVVRLFTQADIQVPRSEALAAWLRALQQPDGSFAAQAEFEKLFRERHPALAQKRDLATREAWDHALGSRAPDRLWWAHSDLEDAWNVLDALDAVGGVPADAAAATRWVRARQRPDGAFRAPLHLDFFGEPYANALSDTVWATRALALLGSAPSNREACIRWLLNASLLPAIIPQWRRLEALGALEAIDRLPSSVLDGWDQLDFSQQEDADLVSHEAYAAIRGHQWLVGAI